MARPLASWPALAAGLRDVLRDVLRSVDGARAAGAPGASALWLRLASHDFVHGQVIAGGHFDAAFFFERRGLGLVGLATGGSMMHYVRLRTLGCPPADPAVS